MTPARVHHQALLHTRETFHEKIAVQWKQSPGKLEVKASAWNFQTTVRYRLDNDTPVLIEYQELNAKIFFYAILAALGSLAVLHLYRRQRS